MRTEFLCISILRVASGPRVKLVLRRCSRCKLYSLLLCGLFYDAICFISYLVLLCSCAFQSF